MSFCSRLVPGSEIRPSGRQLTGQQMTQVDENLYMTAEQAADTLGVQLSSLYSYVSRRKVRSVQVNGSKKRVYWRQDIEGLRRGAHRPADAARDSSTLFHAEPLALGAETALAFISGDGPYYRGRSAVEMAQSCTLEQTAEWLWDAKSSSVFSKTLPRMPVDFSSVRASLSSLGVIEQAAALLMLVDSVNPRSHDFSESGYRRSGADILRVFAAILVGADVPSAAPVHEFVCEQLGKPHLSDLVRRLMVLGAAHELDPSTFAVRAAANAGVTPYYAVIAGMVAYRGHRLPMSRAEPLSSLLEEAVTSSDPKGVIGRRYRSGDRFVGFGSPMYGQVDPRAEALLPVMGELLGEDVEFRSFRLACDEVEELTGLRPGLTVIAAYVGRLLGFEGAEQISCLLLGRSTGWIANAMEQFFTTGLVRPRGRYVGALPPVVPTDD